MSNFQDAISADDLKALYSKATERTQNEMKENAPWKGTGESVGDPNLGIIQQAIDAVDDNCEFSIVEFLKGAHYSIYLYLRNIETQLAESIKEDDTEAIMFLARRLGEIQTIYNSLADALPAPDAEDEEDAE